jgi:hypothetical protein
MDSHQSISVLTSEQYQEIVTKGTLTQSLSNRSGGLVNMLAVADTYE